MQDKDNEYNEINKKIQVLNKIIKKKKIILKIFFIKQKGRNAKHKSNSLSIDFEITNILNIDKVEIENQTKK